MIVVQDVILRPFEKPDADRIYEFRNDAESVRMLGGFSTGYSSDDIQDWIEFHRTASNEVLWAIAKAEDGVCIGHVGLYQIDHRVRKAEFAILIGDAGWRGRGVGLAVTRAMAEFGFSELNLHRIELSVLAFNESAIRLYENAGFKREGIQRDAQFRDGGYHDLVLMAILDEGS